MDAQSYESPCRVVLRSRVLCEGCGKAMTVHNLRYRHRCTPMTERLRQAAEEAHAAVRQRAENTVEAERASRYAHLVKF